MSELFKKMADCPEIQGLRRGFSSRRTHSPDVWLKNGRFQVYQGKVYVGIDAIQELWLAFVMSELHQKKWTKDGWK